MVSTTVGSWNRSFITQNIFDPSKKKMKLNKNISSSRRKQRKRHFNAQSTDLTKQMTAPLSKALKEELGIKRIPVRPNDTVMVRVGKYKKTEGKVVRVNRVARKICIEGVSITKKDGAVRYLGVHPSNLSIVRLSMEKDRNRMIEKIKGQ
ncbi:60S ribosomal protein L26 [Trachipleistophora hominis]|uniref:60S ribosomal protein L26 n=1 Tax=Trachipleistophora hominis TaxID=72359 RepID=L7JVX2_TRAHO|nr:60S ribosomal protein L26 [Trachipleistophora hominis]